MAAQCQESEKISPTPPPANIEVAPAAEERSRGAPSPDTPAAPTAEEMRREESDNRDSLLQIAEEAIRTSKDTVEQTKWIFTVASLIVTALFGVVAFLGYQNLRSLQEHIRQDASDRLTRELAEFKVKLGYATELALRTQTALRQVFLAEKWSESEDGKRQNWRNAIHAVIEARRAAEHLQDSQTQAWTHFFEAYCLRGLKQYQEAIAQQLIGMNLSERSDPLDHYNLACFHALLEQLDQARVHLTRAIDLGGEAYRRHARGDTDLVALRDEPSVAGNDSPAGSEKASGREPRFGEPPSLLDRQQTKTEGVNREG